VPGPSLRPGRRIGTSASAPLGRGAPAHGARPANPRLMPRVCSYGLAPRLKLAPVICKFFGLISNHDFAPSMAQNTGRKNYIMEKDYNFLFESLEMLYVFVLGMYLRINDEIELKDNCIECYLARGLNCLKSINALCKNRCFSDSWVIYRVLLERLFYLRYLNETNEYRVFDDWSFLQSIKYRNHIMSDEEFKDRVSKSEIELLEVEKDRYEKLDNKTIDWKRPRMEDVAKSMKMKFLYDYGYSHASTSVHPLIRDGIEDFLDFTKLGTYKPETIEILQKNTILIGTMLIQEGLNNSNYKWMSIVYDCIDGIRNELDDHKIENYLPMKKLIGMFKENDHFVICGK